MPPFHSRRHFPESEIARRRPNDSVVLTTVTVTTTRLFVRARQNENRSETSCRGGVSHAAFHYPVSGYQFFEAQAFTQLLLRCKSGRTGRVSRAGSSTLMGARKAAISPAQWLGRLTRSA